MDEYGIYQNVRKTTIRDRQGRHWLYEAECTICGETVQRKLYDLQHFNKRCDHQNGKHGIQNRRIANIFRGMKERCYNPQNKNYHWYGAKGIRICDEWLLQPWRFEEWAMKNGYAENLTIDRENGDNDYTPDNCTWVTREENGKYTAAATLLTVNGETHTGRDWATLLHLSNPIINKYLRTYPTEIVRSFIAYSLDHGLPTRVNGRSYIDSYILAIELNQKQDVGVAQLVEHLPSKQDVAGSCPVTHSKGRS